MHRNERIRRGKHAGHFQRASSAPPDPARRRRPLSAPAAGASGPYASASHWAQEERFLPPGSRSPHGTRQPHPPFPPWLPKTARLRTARSCRPPSGRRPSGASVSGGHAVRRRSHLTEPGAPSASGTRYVRGGERATVPPSSAERATLTSQRQQALPARSARTANVSDASDKATRCFSPRVVVTFIANSFSSDFPTVP